MFSIELLPAERGDCLWLTYGQPGDLHHVLIDGGPSETIPTLVPELERRIHELPGRTNRVELLVVTHVDADHIQGIVSLLSDHRRVKLFGDVWFNGFKHVSQFLGGPDGERLTAALESDPGRWNHAFGGGPVVVLDAGPLPSKTLPGGLELTLIAPGETALTKLAPEWEKACLDAGIIPGHGAKIARKSWIRDQFLGGFDAERLAEARFSADGGAPNGSSISLIARYEGKSVLLLGDAPAKAIADGLNRLGPGPHRFSAVKLAHHASRRNTNLDLCGLIRSKKWLVSTNGARFNHPDPECLARVVVTQSKPTFYLNYVTDHVSDFIDAAGDEYTVRLPRRKGQGWAEGISVSL